MNTFTRLLCAAALLVTGQQATAQTLLDNFESTRLVDYPDVQGELAQPVDNPFSSGANTSAKVARYARGAATDVYSTFTVRPKLNGTYGDVAQYRSGARRLSMKFLSPGPGTRVQITMQVSSLVQYPKGNYAGAFFATTTAANNSWETLTFAFEPGPDGTFDPDVKPADVNQLAIIVSPGVSSAATYYIDDLMGPAVVAAPVTGTPAVVLDNFENVRLVDYPAVQGVLTENFANPFSSGVNTSATVAKFERDATMQYATIAAKLKNDGKFSDVSAYSAGGRQLTMKFLSPGPGTRVQLVMQKADIVAYPKGNYAGDFFATTTAAANTWETLTFSFSPGVSGQSFDPEVKATDVDQIAILIAPGSDNNGATYYFDDLMGPAPASTTATRSAQTATAAFGAAYPNPTAGATLLPYSLREPAVVSLAVYDGLGRRVAQVLDQQRQPAGEFSAKLNTAGLAPGLYTCRLLVNGASLTRQLSVQ